MKSILVVAALFFVTIAHAQDEQGAKELPQVGVYVGNVLPNGIDGADEIFPLWGVRYSQPIGSSGGFADFSTFAGHSEGVAWQGVSAGVSLHIPVETLIGHAGIGLDFTRYSTKEVATSNAGGGHFIGGVMSPIGGHVLARFDMKLNSKPGTSLYFAIGLVIEMDIFGGSGGGAAE